MRRADTKRQFQRVFHRSDIQGRGEKRLRPGAELLFMSRCAGRVSHRLAAKRAGFPSLPSALLCGGLSAVFRGAAGPGGVRLPVPLRLYPGAYPQDTPAPEKTPHIQRRQAPSLSQIRYTGRIRDWAAAGHGVHPSLLQIHLPRGHA